MMYNYCLVDVFNLVHRLKGSLREQSKISKEVINYIEDQVKRHIDSDSKLFLLFDPLVLTDLGVEKSFSRSTIRKEILPDYKANRAKDPLIMETIGFLRKYYAYRGEGVVSFNSELYEADDYVGPLLEDLIAKSDKKLTIALLTNDYDWARYICDDEKAKVDMINASWDKPFSKNEFIEKFEFEPTPAANTFYKALFGDTSDCIQGAIFLKKAKFTVPIKTFCRDFIQQVAKENWTVDETIEKFSKAIFKDIVVKKEKDAFESLYMALFAIEDKAPCIETTIRNAKVISSQIKSNVWKYSSWHKERPELNQALYDSVFGVSFKKSFGKF